MPKQPDFKVTAYGTVTPPPDQQADGAESADDNDKE